MVCKPWTTPQEREWLTSHIPAFHESQEQKTGKDFYTKVCKEWEEAFPSQPLSDDAIAKAGSEEKALQGRKQKLNKVSALFLY